MMNAKQFLTIEQNNHLQDMMMLFCQKKIILSYRDSNKSILINWKQSFTI